MEPLFTTVDWAKGSNIYEVNIRQYTHEGTFEAFGKHLPRLRDMGVDILWLMPITPISKKERLGTLGSYYACSSYVGINPEFGTLSDFKVLVDYAHELDFKIIIDWVANHTGWDHHWTKDNPAYYKTDSQGNFTERNGWKDVIDLDYDNAEMREEMINSMRFWVKEFNIDGFRCDMAHLVPLTFWSEARKQCDAIKPLFWLAECEDIAYHDVYDVSYAWAWMHGTEHFMKGKKGLSETYNILHGYSQYPAQALKLFFTSNHDENSWNGTEYEKFGNAAKCFAVFTCTWSKGVPLIYSGQESPSKKRLEFFNKDEIIWNKPTQLHDFYKSLLALHKRDAIAIGETFILPTNNDCVMAFLRRHNQEVVLVLINYGSDNKIHIKVDHDWLDGEFTNIFSGLGYNFKKGETFELMAYDYIVYSK
ncbi:alpha-amylase family glycosyl hydrolase [Parasediminibacterium sp. JCM 36343]|uniref:alpha-amylase family glycosyl hydrolase n=1 Tax=Parasediminibacterium sp. JCM 36343 TaxID=3374279 RepID=UPI00397BDF5F